MRINYPDDIDKEIDAINPYLKLDHERRQYVVRDDAPPGMAERYEALKEKMHQYRVENGIDGMR